MSRKEIIHRICRDIILNKSLASLKSSQKLTEEEYYENDNFVDILDAKDKKYKELNK